MCVSQNIVSYPHLHVYGDFCLFVDAFLAQCFWRIAFQFFFNFHGKSWEEIASETEMTLYRHEVYE